VLSLVPRQNVNRRLGQVATVHAAFALPMRARLLGMRFRGHLCVHFRYGPMARSPSLKMALSINSRVSVSLRSAIQATRLLTITSVGLLPLNTPAFHWTCVGSRTGAIPRGAAYPLTPRFLWECLTSRTVSWFPAPASSNPACRFPALGLPECLPHQGL